MAENTSFFMTAQPKDFASAVPADERFHPEAKAETDSPALVETQFIGFNVPEQSIHSLNYVWAHPNLGIVSGGAWAWQGFKRHQLEAEIFNIHDFMPESVITATGDLDDYKLPLGYGVEVIEPLEKVRCFYSDPSRDNEFDVTLTAIMPPAMISNGRHMDQAMKAEGKLLLRGRPYEVDSYTVRDRSWGEGRPEDARHAPPIHWVTGVFGDDLAIHLSGMEEPSTAPWRDAYPDFPAEAAAQITRGWVWADGELRGLEQATIETDWDMAGGFPHRHTLKLVDTSGREWTAEGTLVSGCEWNTWSNVRMAVGLCRWECEGRVGWGDSQSANWTEMVRGPLFEGSGG